MRNRWVILVLVAMVPITGTVAACTERHRAVCHAPTEDSAITDCDYRDGGWYRK